MIRKGDKGLIRRQMLLKFSSSVASDFGSVTFPLYGSLVTPRSLDPSKESENGPELRENGEKSDRSCNRIFC